MCMQVLDVAMGCLVSASVADLPTILKFVTEQVTPKNAVEVPTLYHDVLSSRPTCMCKAFPCMYIAEESCN